MKSYYSLEYTNGILHFNHPVSANNGKIKIHDYDFSKFVQGKFNFKNVNVYAAGDYIALSRGRDFLSKKLVYNKNDVNDVVALLANWYAKFLIEKNLLYLPSIITTVPRVEGRYDQLKQTREYLFEETPTLHVHQVLIKNDDVNVKDITDDQSLFSLDKEIIRSINNFENGIIVFDDVITTGTTLRQCVEVIREEFEGAITWVALLAASSFRDEFSFWTE